MRLRTRFRLSAAVTFGAFLLLAAAMAWVSRESLRAEEESGLARAIAKGQYERALLRDEYLLFREERVVGQWERKTSDLATLLARADATFEAAEERQLVAEMSARLQAATDSGRPIYLYVTSGAGHGLGTALSVRLDQDADWLSFLIDQLGMKWVP